MKKRLVVLVAIAFAAPLLTHAATYSVKINPDGSFSPPVLHINSGDTVEWTFNKSSDTVIPVNWDGASTSFCSTIRPFSSTDPNDVTGPMIQAPAGIFSLGPLGNGFTVAPTAATCSDGFAPRTTAGAQMLCRGGAYGATLDSTWQDASLTGVFIRLLWKDVQKAAGTADANFDWSALDREMTKAVQNGKLFSVAIKAGDDGTPLWLFTSGVTPLQLQDGGSDDELSGCGVRMTLGDPTEATYQNLYFDLLRKLATHIKSRSDWYRALAYIKPSGANLFSHENRLPKRCAAGCICNTQLFAQRGYRPSGLYAFYSAQNALLASEFPGKMISYALIQDGFPQINETGGYEKSDGTPSNGAPLPGVTEQTQRVINQGQAEQGIRFVVQHNGIQTKKTSGCLNDINALGCPNKWVLQEGKEGQVTGWQTVNEEKVATPAQLDSTILNAWDNSQGVFVEVYEERFFEAVRQPNGIIDPSGSGKTMAQWTTDFQGRRRSLFPTLGDPVPMTHSHTFTLASGTQTIYYVNGTKCAASVTPASIVIAGTTPASPRKRAVRH